MRLCSNLLLCVAVLATVESSVRAATPVATQAGNCSPACPEVLAEVCGSDGVTYDNECMLNYTKCSKNPSLTVASKGKCKGSGGGGTTSEPGCNAGDSCLDVYEPVCGTDGQTYGNDCQLKLKACKDKKLKVAYKGECKASGGGSGTGSSHCTTNMCTQQYDPVCGSDNKTYGNECELNRAKCKNPKLTLKSKGACGLTSETNGTVKPPLESTGTGSGSLNDVCVSKACDKTMIPVCGSDGKTYNNACLLKVAACTDKTLTQKAEGACESSSGSKASGVSKTTDDSKAANSNTAGATKEPQKSSSKGGSKKSSATTTTGLVSLQLVSVCALVVAAWLS